MKQTEGQYDFSDHMALLQFIYKNLHVNPIHQLFLSKEAKFKLQTIRNEHFEKLVDTVLNLCKKINVQFSNESKSVEINKWFTIFINLCKQNIKKSDEFNQFIIRNIPNSEKYKSDIEKIAEYGLFDEFIDKILCSELETSVLSEVIKAWCIHSVDQLHQLVIITNERENQEKLLKDAK